MYIFFLMSPFVALMYSVVNANRTASKNIIWLYCGLFGYCIQVNGDYTGDAVRYVDDFELYINSDYSFIESLSRLYTDTANVEFLTGAINASVSVVSHDYHVLLMIYGLIYGFFFSRNIDYVVRTLSSEVKIKGSLLIVLIAIFLVVPLWNINGFRFWTAMQIFIYSALPYILKRDKTKLVFILLAVLLHSSFIFVIPLLIMFFAFQANTRLLVGLVVISFLLRVVVSQDSLAQIVGRFLPSILLDRYALYLNPEIAQDAGGTFLKPIRMIYGLVVQVSLVSLWWLGRNEFVKNGMIARSVTFGLVCATVLNVLSVIPSVGRFGVLIYYFFFIACFGALSIHGSIIKRNAPILFLFPIALFFIDFFAIFLAEGVRIISGPAIFSPLFLLPFSVK